MTAPEPRRSFLRAPVAILIAGSVCLLIVMGSRATSGLFLKPMTGDLGWGREIFAFAIAIQNLLWGAFQPFASAAAEKWGSGRVLVCAGILYVAGLIIMSLSTDPLTFQLSAGVIMGMAYAGSGNALVLGVVGRTVSPEKRSWAFGLVSAASAAGQFTVVPLTQMLISQFGWPTAYLILASFGAVIVLMAVVLRGRSAPNRQEAAAGAQTISTAIMEAARHNGYRLLVSGFFVCGFHVAFITVHLPAYLTDQGMSAETGALSISLIGFFNVIGCYVSGVLGGRRSKKLLLSWLYLTRAVMISAFILVPISTFTVIVFSVTMGFLWLSTVPLTSGIVGQIFGPRYMGTLFAIVFFGHQLGAFIGVWLGGYVFDWAGTYVPVWWIGAGLGVAAALLHLPIDERAADRVAEAPVSRA